MAEYAGLGLFAALAAGFLGIWLVLAAALRARASGDPVPVASEPRAPEPPLPMWVGYYPVALAAALFELGVVLLYPWAAGARELGLDGALAALSLGIALGAALAYAWLKGALEWE
jgi:NADH:ubiquinone oxidoreductase subunit 3 (subunit A)